MSEIARDPVDLVAQLLGPHHQYPDGAALFLGTMFAPTKDRAGEGQGFTHRIGDVCRVSADELGALANRMTLSSSAPPWQFACGALMRNLARRGLLC
jgi:fumarylacetoacetate (FAA) hydrolase family protein